MTYQNNQNHNHEDIVKDINRQLERISTIEAQERCEEKEEPKWKQWVDKLFGKNNEKININ